MSKPIKVVVVVVALLLLFLFKKSQVQKNQGQKILDMKKIVSEKFGIQKMLGTKKCDWKKKLEPNFFRNLGPKILSISGQ